MPVKDHSVQNNPDATKETNFKSLLEQLESLRVKDVSSPGNVGQLTKGYSSKNVKDPPDFVESLPLIYVPEHKLLMPVKDHSVQNNPDATKETHFKSLLEQLESLRVKDDSSPEHRPLMPVKDHPVQDIPNVAKWTKMVQVDQMLEQLQRMKDDTFPGKAKVPQMIVEKLIPYLQTYKQKALQGDNNVFKEIFRLQLQKLRRAP
ncbi:uncharacterized protein LOC121535097 [Coregonus clupeaformis]|uniref:uncharacterized protein LOC121535097 n=1 Tax=Coregonus clupeaformis TaxID=59861 RepID=UPI001E1C38A4|nr:uncharacterized protein LOC121535097 [Coregonus clupeaformis]